MLDKLFISKQVIANTGLYLSWKHKQLASELFTLPRATTDSAFSLLASINKFLKSLDGSPTQNTQCFGWHNQVWGQKFLNSPHRPNFEASTWFLTLFCFGANLSVMISGYGHVCHIIWNQNWDKMRSFVTIYVGFVWQLTDGSSGSGGKACDSRSPMLAE